MMPIWLPLWQLVEFSNGLAILFIVVCLFTMIAFILRTKPENIDGGSCTLVQNDPEEVRLSYQTSPFRITLPEQSEVDKQTYETGVKCIIKSHRSYWFHYSWGCDIERFHQDIQQSWLTLKTSVLDNTVFGSTALSKNEAQLIHEKERELTLKPVQAFEERDLGEPRTKFPLVIICLINEDDLDCELNETDTVALIAVVHVKDSVCTMDTNFIYKLTKMANGQVLNVTNLYIRSEGTEQTVCSICLTNPVEIGLLPCRHYCVCEVCYMKLPGATKRCPICRSLITKFFRHKVNTNPLPRAKGSPKPEDEEPEREIIPGPNEGAQASDSGSMFSWITSRFSGLLGPQ